MEVKRWFWSAGIAFATMGSTAFADSNEQMIAPTVVQASCDNCQSCSSVCDSGCDGGLVSSGSIFNKRFGKSACDAGGCDSACGCGNGCDGGCDGFSGCDTGLLGYGLLKRSDTCFDDFISPMTNPVFFEDPRTLSEVRFIFLSHQLPGSLGGNSVQVYAMQVRAALTERLSVIATKDGLIYSQSDVLDSGFADIAAGLKYNLYRDACAGRLFSVGMTYEVPSGSNRSLQGNGNGEFHFFTTGATRLGDKAHWISASGIREPVDSNLENSLWYWSNHFDSQVGDRPLWVFSEVNWFHYTGDGTAFGPIEGGDIFNLGAGGVDGNNLVTGALGIKVKPRRNQEVGFAYEVPLTEREGLMASRITADWIIRY